jgi:hypothetical protein
MKIATVVSSNSHIDYIARVVDNPDAGATVPASSDYCFGQFVALEGERENEKVVGIIYDSRLVNPEYGSFGPRSGPRAELGRHNADHVKEQGILIGILLLGTINGRGDCYQGMPKNVVPVGQDVVKLQPEGVRRFHSGSDGKLRLQYYSQLVANSRQFAIPLLGTIIDQLSEGADEVEAQRLNVLKQSLTWQGTFGGMKL